MNPEIAACIDALTPEGEWQVRKVAERILLTLEEEHPESLVLWQKELTLAALSGLIRSRQQSRRSHERSVVRRAKTGDAITEAVEAGSLSPFSLSLCVDKDFTWKPVGDMTGRDHAFVADEYASLEDDNRLLKQFHRQVAKKLGSNHTTREVMTENEYLMMLRSIVGKEAA